MGSNYFSFSAEERAPRSVVKTIARSLLVKEEGCPLVTFKASWGRGKSERGARAEGASGGLESDAREEKLLCPQRTWANKVLGSQGLHTRGPQRPALWRGGSSQMCVRKWDRVHWDGGSQQTTHLRRLDLGLPSLQNCERGPPRSAVPQLAVVYHSSPNGLRHSPRLRLPSAVKWGE